MTTWMTGAVFTTRIISGSAHLFSVIGADMEILSRRMSAVNVKLEENSP